MTQLLVHKTMLPVKGRCIYSISLFEPRSVKENTLRFRQLLAWLLLILGERQIPSLITQIRMSSDYCIVRTKQWFCRATRHKNTCCTTIQNMQPNDQNNSIKPETPPATSTTQSTNSPRQVHYMSVFKSPILLIAIGIFAVLFVIGALQQNEDLKVFLSIPLLAITPIIIGILIIKEFKKK